MSQSTLDATEARHALYQIMQADAEFEEKAQRALELGEARLGVDNGHITKIHPESDYWKAIASTDPADGQFPPGLVLDLETTYCRRTIEQDDPVALHDVPAQGWADDPAFKEHELYCYHGTTIELDDGVFGTVCFVSEQPRTEPFSDEETLFAELIGRMLEHELRRTRTETELARLEEFASVLSHDLRNPLNVAQARIEIERDEHESEHLQKAEAALDRIETLIADVLAAARDGEEIDETELVSVGSLVEECWETVETDEATLTVADDTTVDADRNRLRQLFENCFRNSVEHGGPTVTVRVGELDGEAGFYVADDGPGIELDDREHVFESGYTTSNGGIGLGLSIVHGIAVGHGWDISVTGSREGGARFEIRTG